MSQCIARYPPPLRGCQQSAARLVNPRLCRRAGQRVWRAGAVQNFCRRAGAGHAPRRSRHRLGTLLLLLLPLHPWPVLPARPLVPQQPQEPTPGCVRPLHRGLGSTCRHVDCRGCGVQLTEALVRGGAGSLSQSPPLLLY